jgi:hypothetical protein
MKKQFGKLSKTEQEAIELDYHQMNPHTFDEPMKQAKRHSPELIRLPPELIVSLKKQAKSTGEAEYQAMVKRWIEERLQQETTAA